MKTQTKYFDVIIARKLMSFISKQGESIQSTIKLLCMLLRAMFFNNNNIFVVILLVNGKQNAHPIDVVLGQLN